MTKKQIQTLQPRAHALFGIAAVFAIAGITFLLYSSAATGTQRLEAETGTVSGNHKIKTGASSNNSFVTLNGTSTGGGGTVVALPSGNPTGAFTAISGDKTWGMTSCATEDPICIFTWQTGDMYNTPRGTHSDCGCAEIRNVQTGALIKKINLMDMNGAPKNGYRPYPIYNPFKKEWLIVTQSTRIGWSGASDEDLDRPYGFRVSINGDFVGSAIELSNQYWRGWVPPGVFDTANRKYFVQWHQMVVDYGHKDMFASVINEDGVVTDMDFSINKTPGILDEYGTAVYNPSSGEIVSIHSASAEVDCADCTRNLDVYRLKIDSAGKLSQVGAKNRIDSDNDVEWGIHASYNPVTDTIVLLYREGSSSRDGCCLNQMAVRVLSGQGEARATPADILDVGGKYWTAGTACSTTTNICVGTYDNISVYIDAASTGTTKVSSQGASGVEHFNYPSSRAAYSPITDKFYIYGGNGFVTAPGR